ncbi:ABC transporter ATP-binding protein [Gaetbulibacter saemankumensis]|uniref:ABC transporter ATP-binding protein n=1 Tax=Gaetbulibacter saemankumensis TaxID=311208 RepID=UPI000422CEE4|nr:ABC transporter ATP-binding protein [Gaetbulibacter saemankumensis]
MNKINEHIEKHNDDVLVRVEGLSKKFCKDLKTGLWYGVQDLFSNMRGNIHERLLRPKEFWAVKDVSFELRRGECLGLIGHNGAGKSTLLKILNGLINPDAGKVTITGRVGALIELGAGFNPILSGRENIYNNGAILGFSRQEIDAKLETIIAFAELEEFIDMPVQHYSSGMKVRLGFAVAAQMQPDVLIIDEVLAVGDLGFVLKCFKTIDQLLPNTAMVFVSHSMPMVSRICNQIILMDHGIVEYQGADVGKGIDLYYTRFANNDTNVVFDDGSIKLEQVKILADVNDLGLYYLNWCDDFKLELVVNNLGLDELPLIEVTIYDKEQREVARFIQQCSNRKLIKGISIITIKHDKIQLSKGIYSLSLTINNKRNNTPLMRVNNIASFQIYHDREVWSPFLLDSNLELNEL